LELLQKEGQVALLSLAISVDYIEMSYNSRRRHFYLGYVSPKEFEEMQLLKKAA